MPDKVASSGSSHAAAIETINTIEQEAGRKTASGKTKASASSSVRKAASSLLSGLTSQKKGKEKLTPAVSETSDAVAIAHAGQPAPGATATAIRKARSTGRHEATQTAAQTAATTDAQGAMLARSTSSPALLRRPSLNPPLTPPPAPTVPAPESETQPSDPAANFLNEVHRQVHDGGGLVSQTTNVIVRTWTTPEKGMTLSTAAKPKLNPMVDYKPVPGETAPTAPATAQVVEKGRAGHVRKAGKNQVQMLANVHAPQSAKSKTAASVAVINTLTHDGGLEQQAARLFTKPEQATQVQQLLQTLNAALRPAADEHGTVHGTVMPLTNHLLVMQHLAHVSGGDAARALAALEALQEGSFLPLPGHANGAPALPTLGDLFQQNSPRTTSAPAQRDALSVAAHLASTPVEFKALLSVMKPVLNEQQTGSVKRLLEATAQIETEQGGQVDLFHHAAQAQLHIESGKATLAQTVLHIETTALQRTGNIYAPLQAAEKSAIFSWNNGFRQSGAGSDLAKAQGRLAKMTKYVHRASHMQDLRSTGFDRHKPFSSAAKVIDANARIAAARLNQAVGRKKSPLMPLASLGSNNASLMHPEDDLVTLYKSTTTAVGLLHTYLQEDIASKPLAGLQQHLLQRQLPAAVEHAAVLGHWQSLLETHTPLGHKLDSAAVHAMAVKIATDYGVATALPSIERNLGHWIGRELTVSDLKDWAEMHHAPTSNLTRLGVAANAGTGELSAAHAAIHEAALEAAPEAPTLAIETELGKALRLAHDINASSSKPKDLTPDGLHQFMRTYLQEHNSGNPVTVANGSSIGLSAAPVVLSIKKISEAFSHISPVTVTPTFDLRASRAHNAVVSFGSTTHGFEVFVGTQTQVSGALGGGIGISTHPFAKHIGFQAGAAAAVAAGTDYAKTRGVMVRSVRPEKDDGSAMDTPKARAEIVAFSDLMFAMAKEKKGSLTPAAVWEKVAGEFFESKSLSIGWQDQTALTPHLTGTVGGNYRIGAGTDVGHGGSAGFSLAHTVDFTPSGSNGRKEANGANRLLRNTNFDRTQQVTTIAAVAAGTSMLMHSAGTDTESLSLPQLSKAWNYQISDKGFSATFRTIVEKGALSDPFTLRDMEERDAGKFVKILQQPERYAQYLQVFNGRYGIEHGKQKLDEFVQKTQNWAGPGQHYVMRSRVKAEVRGKLDELAALANAVNKQDSKSPTLQHISNQMLHLLRDEASWVPIEIMALEAQTARDAMGINFGVQFAAQDSVVTDRELSFVAVPLPVAHDWVATPAAGADTGLPTPTPTTTTAAETTASTPLPPRPATAPVVQSRTPEPQSVQRPAKNIFGKISSKFADLKHPVRKELRHMPAQELDRITHAPNDGSRQYREARKELDKRLKSVVPEPVPPLPGTSVEGQMTHPSPSDAT